MCNFVSVSHICKSIKFNLSIIYNIKYLNIKNVTEFSVTSYLGESDAGNVDDDAELSGPGVSVCDTHHLRDALAGDVTEDAVDRHGVTRLPADSSE